MSDVSRDQGLKPSRRDSNEDITADAISHVPRILQVKITPQYNVEDTM